MQKQALHFLEEKKKKVESFFSVANMFEVPVKKSAYAEAHVPLQRKIVPIAHEYKKEDVYSISDTNYADILATIKHMGSTYERMPGSYAAMKEEDLRNILLAALNHNFMILLEIKNLWKAEYAKLIAERKMLNQRYLGLKEEVKEAEQIRKSIYSILRQEQRKQPRKAQDMER